jgi:hypothetical protein
MAVLPDGRRVVTVGMDGRMQVWDPAAPGARAAQLGRLKGTRVARLGGHKITPVVAVAVLPDGRVVSDRRVLVQDVARPTIGILELNCSVTALATAPLGPAMSRLVIAHERGGGFAVWSVAI